jgi:hypothetical protein
MLSFCKSDGSFCTGFYALGLSTTEIAHIHDVFENFDRTDRAGLFTDPTQGTHGGRNDNLSQRAQRQSLFWAFQTIFFFTLDTHHRTIDAQFIEIQDLDPGQSVADLPRVEKSTDNLALLTSGAFEQIGLNQVMFLVNPLFPGDSVPVPSDLGKQSFLPFSPSVRPPNDRERSG